MVTVIAETVYTFAGTVIVQVRRHDIRMPQAAHRVANVFPIRGHLALSCHDAFQRVLAACIRWRNGPRSEQNHVPPRRITAISLFRRVIFCAGFAVFTNLLQTTLTRLRIFAKFHILFSYFYFRTAQAVYKALPIHGLFAGRLQAQYFQFIVYDTSL